MIHLTQEICGFDVFPSAVLVFDPLARIAVVIQVDHGGDGINPDSVDVIFVEPEEGVGDEVVADFGAFVVKD